MEGTGGTETEATTGVGIGPHRERRKEDNCTGDACSDGHAFLRLQEGMPEDE